MKKCLRCCLLLRFLMLHLVSLAQQDIHFSQFYEFPLLRNPALAGIFNGHFRVSAGYRNQWQSVTVPYRTMYVGGEFKMMRGMSDGDFVTAGIQASSDVAGDSRLQRTQVLPVLNYHKLLNEEKTSYLSFAITGGPVFERFDVSKLKFDDQFVNGAYSASNPTRQQFDATSLTYTDLAAGVSYKTEIRNNVNMYVGAAMFHVNQPTIAFTNNYDVKLNRKFVVNAGLSAYINDIDKLVAYADVFLQGGSRMFQLGGLFTHSFDYTGEDKTFSVAAGAVYRWKDALVPILKLYTGQLGIGVSYDVNISKLSAASQFRGGFELSLSYMGMWEVLAKALESVECPIRIW